jgi:hypothetical protein
VIGNGHPPSTSFKWYAHYMEHGYKDAEVRPDRVEWVETRNLPTNNMHAGARIMAATARDSDSIQPPVYRLTISFDQGDPVDRDTMRKVADRTLRDLGLEEYQVVIVAHRDRAHRHLHLMVNRVHPKRLNVWSNWWDWRRIERSLRKQEEELGLRSVPGKHARTPGRTRAPAPRRVRGDAGFLARAQAQAGPHLLHAQSWAEVERGLGEHGLSVQIKHGGMVVTDGTYEVKASEIDRAASRKHLERRLGPLGDYRARQAVAARTLDERAARVAPVPSEVQRGTPALEPTPLPVRPAPVAPAPVRPPVPLEVRHPAPQQRTPQVAPPAPAVQPSPRRPRTYLEAGRDFSRDVRAFYADPAAARRAFLDTAERRGPERAAATLRENPARFGALRSGADPARAAPAAAAGYEYARHRGARLRPALVQSAQHLRDAARAGPYGVTGDLREAAAILMAVQIEHGVTPEYLARRLAPMLPGSAAGLTRQALRIGAELVREQEGRERERGGLSR